MQINNGQGGVLQILVENLGRQSYGILSEKKGIVGDVMLNGKRLERWNVTGFAFADMTKLTGLLDALDYVQQHRETLKRMEQTSKKLNYEPIIFSGTFDVTNGTVYDTFIDTRGWGKVFLNVLLPFSVALFHMLTKVSFFSSSFSHFNPNQIRVL